MRSKGMCLGDAKSYLSKSHTNGNRIDISYKTTLAEEQKKVNTFHEYGFKQILRGRNSFYGILINSNYLVLHENHLHAGDFNDNFVQPLY